MGRRRVNKRRKPPQKPKEDESDVMTEDGVEEEGSKGDIAEMETQIVEVDEGGCKEEDDGIMAEDLLSGEEEGDDSKCMEGKVEEKADNVKPTRARSMSPSDDERAAFMQLLDLEPSPKSKRQETISDEEKAVEEPKKEKVNSKDQEECETVKKVEEIEGPAMKTVKPETTKSCESSENIQLKSTNDTSSGSEENKSTDVDQEGSATVTNEAPGKLRSSVADAEGMALARRYGKCLKETEEFALDYMSREFHHPVISCFRELTRTDVSVIVGSGKLKKSCNSLEQSIIYLSLIDLLATVNNNPLYGEHCNMKFSKNISGSVQKILLEFKNIIGTWALSGNEQLSSRYTLILGYLRRLVPLFKKAGFDEEFSTILDCIEKEVTRCRSNQEKLKAMGSAFPASSENSVDKKVSDSLDGEARSALNEIVLNVKLNVKHEDSDDDDVTLLKQEKSTKIFGKPLKASPKTSESSKKPKKIRGSLDFRDKANIKGDLPVQKNTSEIKTSKSHSSVKMTSLPTPNTLAPMFQSSASSPTLTSNKTKLFVDKNSNKTISTKRSADEELNRSCETKKKLKLAEDVNSKCGTNDVLSDKKSEKPSIRSYFQTNSPSSTTGNNNTSLGTTKPAVNAFAIMMNRSRELAQKKKMDKVKVNVPTLKLDAVKT